MVNSARSVHYLLWADDWAVGRSRACGIRSQTVQTFPPWMDRSPVAIHDLYPLAGIKGRREQSPVVLR
jgi:hypothetical protein